MPEHWLDLSLSAGILGKVLSNSPDNFAVKLLYSLPQRIHDRAHAIFNRNTLEGRLQLLPHMQGCGYCAHSPISDQIFGRDT